MLRGEEGLLEKRESKCFCRSFVINLILFLQLEEGRVISEENRLLIKKTGYGDLFVIFCRSNFEENSKV